MTHRPDRTDPPPTGPPRRRRIDGGLATIATLALAGGAAVWWRDGPSRVIEIIMADLAFGALLLPKVIGGVLLASALALLMPRDRVRALVGPETGWRGLAIAAAAGALIPGGPSVTYPLTAGLIAAGADLGAAVAMITGWILLGVNRTVIWELSFLPAELVALRYVGTLWVPVAAGLAVRALTDRAARR